MHQFDSHQLIQFFLFLKGNSGGICKLIQNINWLVWNCSSKSKWKYHSLSSTHSLLHRTSSLSKFTPDIFDTFNLLVLIKRTPRTFTFSFEFISSFKLIWKFQCKNWKMECSLSWADPGRKWVLHMEKLYKRRLTSFADSDTYIVYYPVSHETECRSK